ncbi:hypothetical protein B4119_3321 [Parageobacillus caldoxylosilyticus]|uniref:Uncharacterized protein n=1 Tax=Saccharococcus caldoxylosilyticus TaxID=81408 RepID=A0A150LIF1_9BACL|nr:hypothetical protein B4119_3321 [Parageobacillus caldoxylosilyticus]
MRSTYLSLPSYALSRMILLLLLYHEEATVYFLFQKISKKGRKPEKLGIMDE